VAGTFTNSGAGALYEAGSNVLTVAGNFVNSGAAVFNAGSGSVLTSGNWNNTGTFDAGSGTVTFESNGVQMLTGATAFYRVNRINGGSLQLNSDISVSELLALTSGNIVTGT